MQRQQQQQAWARRGAQGMCLMGHNLIELVIILSTQENVIRLCTSSNFEHVQRPRHSILVFQYDVQAEYRRREYQR